MDARFIAGVAWLAAAGLHTIVPRETAGLEPPSTPVLAALSGGHRTAAASAAWSATVLHYANTIPRPEALERGIRTAVLFDPGFLPPLAQGTLMLRATGAAERTPALLELGMENHPTEPWFPWAMGMHLWLTDDDPEQAAVWLDRAADLEPSSIHREAAQALRTRR